MRKALEGAYNERQQRREAGTDVCISTVGTLRLAIHHFASHRSDLTGADQQVYHHLLLSYLLRRRLQRRR